MYWMEEFMDAFDDNGFGGSNFSMPFGGNTTTDNSGFPPASINQAATLKTRPQAQASKPAIIKIPRPAEVKGVYLAPENRKNKILVRFNQY